MFSSIVRSLLLGCLSVKLDVTDQAILVAQTQSPQPQLKGNAGQLHVIYPSPYDSLWTFVIKISLNFASDDLK